MANENWTTKELGNIDEVESALLSLKGKKWVCRGQQKVHGGKLLPSIDREKDKDGNQNWLYKEDRSLKLKIERRSIEIFRSTAKHFFDGEKEAIKDDFVALMVLQHYGTPTRLLDWTMNPLIAACFATEEESHDNEDGVIWAFDHKQYEKKGAERWKELPETTSDGSGDPAKFDGSRVTFNPEYEKNYIFCIFYPKGFPRLNAQNGLVSISCQFYKDEDHGEMLYKLLDDDNSCHKYIIKRKLKSKLRDRLKSDYGIDRFTLYPDTYGAAQLAGEVFKKNKNPLNQEF